MLTGPASASERPARRSAQPPRQGSQARPWAAPLHQGAQQVRAGQNRKGPQATAHTRFLQQRRGSGGSTSSEPWAARKEGAGQVGRAGRPRRAAWGLSSTLHLAIVRRRLCPGQLRRGAGRKGRSTRQAPGSPCGGRGVTAGPVAPRVQDPAWHRLQPGSRGLGVAGSLQEAFVHPPGRPATRAAGRRLFPMPPRSQAGRRGAWGPCESSNS